MQFIPAKTILQKVKFNGNLWFGIDYNINLYKGCNQGCIYCDSRSARYYIDDFDRVRVKENCLAILTKELSRKMPRGVIGLGAMSDSYNHYEKNLQVTRGTLALIERYGFGVSLETKRDLVTRDIDILKRISEKSSCILKLSITTSDDSLARKIEPFASLPSERFRAIRQLSDNGIFTGVLLTPVLPIITDSDENIKNIVKLAHEHGAKFIFSLFGVTLRDIQRGHFFEKLERYFPMLKQQYMMTYSDRYQCNIPDMARKRALFINECEKYGLLYRMDEIIAAYKQDQPEPEQLRLF